MTIHNIILPTDISAFITGISEFSTSRIMTKSGLEICSSDQQIVRRCYCLSECKISIDSFEHFNNFFLGRNGSRYGFLLKDHFDYKAEKQILSFKNNKLLLQKTYPDLCNPYVRTIKYPIIETLILYLDNTRYYNFTIDNNAEITVNGELNPDKIFTATFEFLIPVRFKQDTYKYKLCNDGTIILYDIEIQEIII
ncbi:MAG: DUF2460 domain-containing protein [Rickettsiaceae bacterium]|nr:DUF2460 domain-containing protein [Rickettsiaceae bacterium]